MFRSVVFLACFLVVSARIPFEYCEEGYPGPTYFDIPECSSIPCAIRVGDEFTVNIGIYVKSAVKRLPVRATVTTEKGVFDFPLPSGDACHAIENGCPQEAGDYLLTFPIKVQGVEPGTTATIRVQIDDDSDDVVACGSITTTIQ